MRDIRHIVIHHSGNVCTVEGIRELHVNKKGWDDIGYHFMIDELGNTHTGRDIEIVGAHVSNHNKHSIGICLLGNFDEKEVPTAQLKGLKEMVGHLMITFELNKPDVSLHRDFPSVKKSCPGKNITKEMLF